MEITEDTILKGFKAISVWKNLVPNDMCGSVVYCAKVLCDIFRFIFQASIG